MTSAMKYPSGMKERIQIEALQILLQLFFFFFPRQMYGATLNSVESNGPTVIFWCVRTSYKLHEKHKMFASLFF